MSYTLRELKRRIDCASTKEKSSLVIKNITIIDVFQQEQFVGDVAIEGKYIVGIGTYEGITEIDGTNQYICPGLMDAHVHIESSMVSPKEYYKVALQHGVTSVVMDPHEIANVLGGKGVELMLELTQNIPFDMYVMLPSCVPATNFEDSGAILQAKDLKSLYQYKNVIGLAEVMNVAGVMNTEDDLLEKILTAINQGYQVDGHGAGFNLNELNAYLSIGILTDHECSVVQEVTERLQRGMYVFLREGTVAKNLKDLIPIVNEKNSRRVCFCTDDKHIDDLVKEGSIDYAIKLAIGSGLTIETAIQMATLNVAECYQLKHKGAIAPGFIADFIILDDLNDFKIHSVYKEGKRVIYQGKLQNQELNEDYVTSFENSVHLPRYLDENSFKIPCKNHQNLHVIEIIPNKLETNHLIYPLSSLNTGQYLESDIQNDLLKVAVIERHHQTGQIGLGMIKGLKLQNGAIATTISHDSHNLITCGTNDTDMLLAARHLQVIGGGIVIVNDGEVIAQTSLEIGGLMTKRGADDVIKELTALHAALERLSPSINFNPFLTLSFLSLPVIPSLKLTDRGLFDVNQFEFISILT